MLPDLGQLVAVSMHVSGDVAHALVESVRGGKMGIERETTALLLAGIWCTTKTNQPVPTGLIAQARTLARRVTDSIFPQLTLLALADLIQDQSLSAVLNSLRFPKSQLPLQELISRLIDPVKDSALGNVPERPGPITHSGYTLRRAVPRVGRNDPCPCGSGKNTRNVALRKTRNTFRIRRRCRASLWKNCAARRNTS